MGIEPTLVAVGRRGGAGGRHPGGALARIVRIAADQNAAERRDLVAGLERQSVLTRLRERPARCDEASGI